MSKRYRTNGSKKKGSFFQARKRARSNGKRFVPGKSRTSGYYGRYPMTGGELKFHDIDIDDAIIAQNGTIFAAGTVHIIPQGTTEITRIGRKAVIKSINWRYNMQLPNSGALNDTSDVVRVILYLDKQCNGAIAAVTDILESDNFQSFRNLANTGRFSILLDRTFAIHTAAAAGNGTANDSAAVDRSATFYKQCNIPIEFNSTTGALTEIRSNNLNVLLLSKQGLVVFDSKMRLRFSDGH